MWIKIKEFFNNVYVQLVKSNDSPQRTALGFGVGVFLGIYPGTGPFAALAVAYCLRLNKAATLLGGVLTNTWLSLVSFVLAVKLGAGILGLEWTAVEAQAKDLISHFSFKSFFDVSFMTILKPLLIGYAVVGFVCGFVSYLLVLFVLKRHKTSGH